MVDFVATNWYWIAVGVIALAGLVLAISGARAARDARLTLDTSNRVAKLAGVSLDVHAGYFQQAMVTCEERGKRRMYYGIALILIALVFALYKLQVIPTSF